MQHSRCVEKHKLVTMSGPPLPPRERSVVVDEELVLSSIREEMKARASDGKAEEGETKVYDMPALSELTMLRLSFKNVYQIDNLVDLDSLVELRLDNNTIKKIENLGHLKNLTWLDLSFNNIEVIEGLETLTKLTDLSLYNNAISTIEGLDTLVNLNVLSLGNNKIKSTDQIQYLRKFEHLKVVNLEGNPVFDQVDYKTVVLAYLKHLEYLDYKLVDPDEVTQSREACQDDLMELEDNEALEAAAKERDDQRKAHLQQLAEANLVVTETLFQGMLKEDSDLPKFKVLPGITDLLEEFEDDVKTAAAAFQAVGLEKHQQVVTEEEHFKKSSILVGTRTDKAAIDMCVAYRKQAKQAFIAIHKHEDPHPNMLDDLKGANDELRKQLLRLEVECVEQKLEVTDAFEIAYGEIKAEILDHQQTFFRAVEASEDSFNEAIVGIAEQWVKQAQEGNLDAVSDELAALATDRDSLFGYITGSHDTHVGKLLAFEDECRERTNKRYADTLGGARAAERKRNRDRIVEVNHLYEHNLSNIREVLEDLFGEED